MRYVDESAVAAHLSPAQIFRHTQGYLTQTEWRDSPRADSSSESPRVKVGYRGEQPAAYRLRLDDGPARFLTVLGAGGPPVAAVSSTYLTYQRTAALLLTAPWLASADGNVSILVVGGGPLGWATARMAVAVFDRPGVHLYAQSGGPRTGPEEGIEIISRCPDGSRFDVVITATTSTRSLADQVPLESARWLIVGGSARTGAEVADVPLGGRRQFSDNPANARSRRLLDDPSALLTVAALDRTDEPSVVVICGGGGIDGYLAAECIQKNS
jgi:hypothetical protein